MNQMPPSPPAQMAPLQAQAVSIRTADGTVLTGEFTLPTNARAGQKYPTVILLHGSGANDMNVTLPEQVAGTPGGSAIFKQLAERLGQQGFAVMRFNKRGVTGVGPVTLPRAERVGPAYTISGYTQDALDVLNFTRQLAGVDTRQVFLLGHSEGTLLAAKLAQQHPELLRGLILIGTVGDTFRDTLHWQMVDSPVQQVQAFDQNRDGWLSIDELTSAFQQYGLDLAEQADALGLQRQGQSWAFLPELNSRPDGAIHIQNSFRARLEQAFSPYPQLPDFPAQQVLYFRDADAFGSVTQLLPAYAGAVLMLHGEADPQTTLKAAQKTYAAMQQAGRKNVTFNIYPGLGHTLSPLKSGQPTLGPIADAPLNDLITWLKRQVR